jgi:transposase
VALMVDYMRTKEGLSVSEDTVERALKDMGYTYKRLAKSIPTCAPTKDEKKRRIKQIVDEILALMQKRDCEIFALDESHFSTEPYLVRGWQKKGGHLKIPCPIKRERLTFFGCLNLRTKKFYWKKSKQTDSDAFIWFLTQLRQRFTGKDIVIILDNSSIHKSKKVREYLNRFSHIHMFFLPTYSPEYNPVERIWGWIKAKVYGLLAVGGIYELVVRFRKLIWHFNVGNLTKPIQLNLYAYCQLL